MKRWGIAVLGLYLVVLTVIGAPLILVAFWPEIGVREALECYVHMPYWIWILVMVIGEMLLLLVPVRNTERRPKSRRILLVPIITTSFFLVALVFLFLTSIMFAVWGDENPIFDHFNTIALLSLVLLWAGWGLLFYRFNRNVSPDKLIKRATSWLLKGSILELLIAVPCHVVVRRRDDCCAPVGTLIGIAAGLSIMLLSFGPGVFFLFLKRYAQLHPKVGLEDKGISVS